MQMKIRVFQLFVIFLFINLDTYAENLRLRIDFTEGWKFYLGDQGSAGDPGFVDSSWRSLNLPHDWSIEGEFNKENPTKINGGHYLQELDGTGKISCWKKPGRKNRFTSILMGCIATAKYGSTVIIWENDHLGIAPSVMI
jgi:hypothetical protein